LTKGLSTLGVLGQGMSTMPTEDVSAEFKIPNLRLARHGTPPRTDRMKRFLKKLGISSGKYLRWSGSQPLNKFRRENPGWTQRAWEVLILENRDITQGRNERALSLSGKRAKVASGVGGR